MEEVLRKDPSFQDAAASVDIDTTLVRGRHDDDKEEEPEPEPEEPESEEEVTEDNSGAVTAADTLCLKVPNDDDARQDAHAVTSDVITSYWRKQPISKIVQHFLVTANIQSTTDFVTLKTRTLVDQYMQFRSDDGDVVARSTATNTITEAKKVVRENMYTQQASSSSPSVVLLQQYWQQQPISRMGQRFLVAEHIRSGTEFVTTKTRLLVAHYLQFRQALDGTVLTSGTAWDYISRSKRAVRDGMNTTTNTHTTLSSQQNTTQTANTPLLRDEKGKSSSSATVLLPLSTTIEEYWQHQPISKMGKRFLVFENIRSTTEFVTAKTKCLVEKYVQFRKYGGDSIAPTTASSSIGEWKRAVRDNDNNCDPTNNNSTTSHTGEETRVDIPFSTTIMEEYWQHQPVSAIMQRFLVTEKIQSGHEFVTTKTQILAEKYIHFHTFKQDGGTEITLRTASNYITRSKKAVRDYNNPNQNPNPNASRVPAERTRTETTATPAIVPTTTPAKKRKREHYEQDAPPKDYATIMKEYWLSPSAILIDATVIVPYDNTMADIAISNEEEGEDTNSSKMV